MKLSEQIIKIRTDNNLTQEELANELFVTRQAVSKWERGQSIPDIETLRQISIKYKISLNVLLETTNIVKEEKKTPLAYKTYKVIVIHIVSILLCLLVFSLYITAYLNEPVLNGYYKLMLVITSIVFVINVFCIFLTLSKPKVLIEYNDYGLFINNPKTIFIKYEDIVDVTVYHRRLRRMLTTYVTITIITKKEEYQLNGVGDIDKVSKKIIELKTKNTMSEIA